MTDSLNTLNTDTDQSVPRQGLARFGYEMFLVAGLLGLTFWSLTLISYSTLDPAWSTSGATGNISLHNWMGHPGAVLADACYFAFGFSTWWLVLIAVHAWLRSGWRWLRSEGMQLYTLMQRLSFWGGVLLLMGGSCMLEWTRLYQFEDQLPGQAGGVLGYLLGLSGMRWLGFNGSALLGIVSLLLGLALVFRFSWSRLAEGLGITIDVLVRVGRQNREKVKDEAEGRKAAQERAQVLKEVRVESDTHTTHAMPTMESTAAYAAPISKPSQPPRTQETAQTTQAQQPIAVPSTIQPSGQGNRHATRRLPLLGLLDSPATKQETISSDTLEMTCRLIEKKLKDFGVAVHVHQAVPGPVVTRYELELAPGVQNSQLANLTRELARALSLPSIRMVDVADKHCMALELPNTRRRTIRLSEILGSKIFQDADSLLTLGLGLDVAGNPVIADLAKMSHLLVAGAAGTGKSVCLNSIVLSLLYKAEAKDVRLLMIDPKMLDMSAYEGISHLLCPVVTDMQQATQALHWCVGEMERRHKMMNLLGVRNLAGYNAKIDAADASGKPIANPFSLNAGTDNAHEPLERWPHIVIVIDELADLVTAVGKKIEELIARLAHKARAAGIHLILSTQRPHAEVITGLIKANIPARIALQVSNKLDSQTILDQVGAEALLGMGDMLYLRGRTGSHGESAGPLRIHGAFVAGTEVQHVASFLKELDTAHYIEEILRIPDSDTDTPC